MPPRKRSGQEAPASGSPAPPLHGGYWAVRPGAEGPGPEYFERTHAGMKAAMTRIVFLAYAPVRELTVSEEGGPARVLWRYEHGVCTLRPAGLVPAGDARLTETQDRRPMMPASDELTPEQLARLPRYAQDHIAWQAMRLRDADKAIAGLRAGPDGSNVLIEHYGDSPDHQLGINTEVCFRLATAGHPDGKIRVSHGLGVIEVACSDGALHVTPQSSNVIRVRIGEY
jgi:hypothetical protein